MSVPFRVHVGGILAAAFLLVGASCERSSDGPNDGEPTDEGGVSDSSELLESKGESCSTDPDCSGYLRCLERTCRIPPAVEGESDEDTPTVTFHEEGSDEVAAEFYVELATTEAQRHRGLMYRPKMADDWGMLFVYEDAAVRKFYMKNTRIPLDMIFMDPEGNVVHVVREAEPETLQLRSSREPAQFVLEVNGGLAEKYDIEAGDWMTLENLPERD